MSDEESDRINSTRIQKRKVSAGDFDDVDSSIELMGKEDEYSDDLEKQIDFADVDDGYLDEKIRNELLFAVQGLGSTKKMNDIDFYMKGPHCEDSLKDILKLCTKYDNEKYPIIKLELGKWEVLQKDLVQLLISQVQDRKLSYHVLILMGELTKMPDNKVVERRDELLEYLRSYKLAFTSNSNLIQTINLHLSDCLEIVEEERSKLFEHMIELIISLYRNLLKIPDSDGAFIQKKTIQPQLLVAIHQQNGLDIFIYLVQRASSNLMKQIGFALLEIFYHIFSSFEPVWFFQTTEQDKSLIQRIREKEKRNREMRLSEMSTRHARFDCNIKVVRSYGEGAKIIHNPFKSDFDPAPLRDTMKGHKPKRPKGNLTSIFPNNQDKQLINSALEEDELKQNTSLKSIIRDYAIDFVEHVYDKLMEIIFNEICERTEKENKVKTKIEVDIELKIHYFVVLGFGLEVFRYNLHSKKELHKNMHLPNHPNNDEYSLASVGSVLQLTIIEVLKTTIVDQVTIQKKGDFSPRLTHAALYGFLQLLYVVKEMKVSVNEVARKAAQFILQKIFTLDISKMLGSEFQLYLPGIHDNRFGDTLVEFMGLFFDLMEEYSKGKIMKIQGEGRLIKRKNYDKIKERRRLKKEKEREKRIRQKEQKRIKKEKEREKRKRQKEKEKSRNKKEKERAKLEKKKKKKKKHDKFILDQDENQEGRQNEDQENMLGEEEYYNISDKEGLEPTRTKSQEGMHNEQEHEKNENEQGNHQPIPATVGTEYTLGSSQSEINPTIDNVGPTLETLIPYTLERVIDETAASIQKNQQEVSEIFEHTLEKMCPTSEMEIENNGEHHQQQETNLNNPDEENYVTTQLISVHPTMEEEDIGINIQQTTNNDVSEQLEKERAKDIHSEEDDEDEGEDEKEIESETDNKSDSEIEKSDQSDDNEEIESNKEIEEEEEDDDDEEEEEEGRETYATKDRFATLSSELAYLANYKVLDTLLNMITVDKLETNNQKINNAITNFMKRVVYILKTEWLFFQIDYLLIFRDILNTRNPKLRIDNPELFEIVHLIVRKFFVVLRKNRLLSVECLFRFHDFREKDKILNNYEEKAKVTPGGEVDDDEDQVEHDLNGGFYLKKRASVWDERSDLILIQNYEDYKDLENCEIQLCLLFTKLNMTEITIKDIKKRIKTFKLNKGKQVAQEIYQEMYENAERPPLEKTLEEALGKVERTSFTKSDIIEFLLNMLNQYVNFQNYIKITGDDSKNIDMAIVPVQRIDFDILEFSSMYEVFRSMNLKEPKQGECYWRVPHGISDSEIETMIEKIKAALPDPNNKNKRDILTELPIIQENEMEELMIEEKEKVGEMVFTKNFDSENKENEIEIE